MIFTVFVYIFNQIQRRLNLLTNDNHGYWQIQLVMWCHDISLLLNLVTLVTGQTTHKSEPSLSRYTSCYFGSYLIQIWHANGLLHSVCVSHSKGYVIFLMLHSHSVIFIVIIFCYNSSENISCNMILPSYVLLSLHHSVIQGVPFSGGRSFTGVWVTRGGGNFYILYITFIFHRCLHSKSCVVFRQKSTWYSLFSA